MKQTNHFFLSGLFLIAFLTVEFTDIYGNPEWFKAFVLILSATFLISGIAKRKKSNNDSEQSIK